MEALYGADRKQLRGRKREWLDRFKSDGFWLLDVSLTPVNKLSGAGRRRALEMAAPEAARKVVAMQPQRGVVVCHSMVFKVTFPWLIQAGLRILHNEAIPFPLGDHRKRFVHGVRKALGVAGMTAPLIPNNNY